MADCGREQKLASARKKLRQFQKRKGHKGVSAGLEGTPKSEAFQVCEDEAGSISSFASSVDLSSEEFTDMAEKTDPTSSVQPPQMPEQHIDILNSLASTPPVPDSQVNTTSYSTYQQGESIILNQDQTPRTIENTQELDQDCTDAEDRNLASTVPSSQSEPFISDTLSYGLNQSVGDESSDISTEHTLTGPLSPPPALLIEPDTQDTQGSQDMLEREGSVSSETTASVMTAIHVPGRGSAEHQPVLKSSSESLRQISLQLSGLMMGSEGNEGASVGAVSELERRNAELAALLQHEREASQIQQQHSTHLKSHLEKVEAELTAAHGVLSSAGRPGREMEGLREQLQVHIQTIGILVAEKSDLESKLTQADLARKRKTEEVIELEGRLGASRQRVREVEGRLGTVTGDRDCSSSLLETQVKELEAKKATNLKTNKLCEDLRATVAELTERLSVKTQDFDKLLTQLSNTKSELSMASLNIQQLRDSTGEEAQSQLEKVMVEHRDTQKQLESSQAMLTQATADNSQMAAHYQHYTAQLTAHAQALQDQTTQLTTEKEELVASLKDQESRLKAMQQPEVPEGAMAQLRVEKEQLHGVITGLQGEMLQLKEHNAALTNDNIQLSKYVDQLSNTVEGLEMEVERSKTRQVDTTQLLEAMQSDKVAAARALTQNKQLKEQLEELQSGFIIMSNKKLELTEKLEKELHVKKALNQEITSLNETIANIRHEALLREREITALRESNESLSSHLAHTHSQAGHHHLQHHLSQDTDHLDQDYSTLTEEIKELEDKLKISKVDIEDLTRQNTALHTLLTEHRSAPHEEGVDQETGSDGRLLGQVATLTATVSRLEAECSSVKAELEGERDRHNTVQGEFEARDEAGHHIITTEPRGGALEQKLHHLQDAHEVLESRFTRSMKDVAELSDEKQQLEHVVQQLQLETESIGDYITIYQFQRGVMKQQARERELELSSLHHEREETKEKLATLQDLVSKLVQEKAGDHHYLQRLHRVLQSPTAITNGIGTSEAGSKEAAEEVTTSDHQPGTENGSHHHQPSGVEEGREALSITSNGPQEDTVKSTDTEDAVKKTKAVTATPKSPTVQRILDLLNEMEATSHLEHSGLQKFHPCPLCSGKLITV